MRKKDQAATLSGSKAEQKCGIKKKGFLLKLRPIYFSEILTSWACFFTVIYKIFTIQAYLLVAYILSKSNHQIFSRLSSIEAAKTCTLEKKSRLVSRSKWIYWCEEQERRGSSATCMKICILADQSQRYFSSPIHGVFVCVHMQLVFNPFSTNFFLLHCSIQKSHLVSECCGCCLIWDKIEREKRMETESSIHFATNSLNRFSIGAFFFSLILVFGFVIAAIY